MERLRADEWWTSGVSNRRVPFLLIRSDQTDQRFDCSRPLQDHYWPCTRPWIANVSLYWTCAYCMRNHVMLTQGCVL